MSELHLLGDSPSRGMTAGPIDPIAPAGPAGPAGPGRPRSPNSPPSPGPPRSPISPLCPLGPLFPLGPIAPTSPLGPAGTLRRASSSISQTDPGLPRCLGEGRIPILPSRPKLDSHTFAKHQQDCNILFNMSCHTKKP